MEIDLFLYANPKERLCGMLTVHACGSVDQHQNGISNFPSIKICGF
jgi:hypothetical protein